MATLFKGADFHFLDSIESTNTFAWQKITGPTDTPIVVTAKEQYKGRGMASNSWHSAYAKNLLLSLGFCPFLYGIDNPFLINKITSLAAKEAVAMFVKNKTVSIKWPNDIYIGSKKTAGILIENSFKASLYEHVVVGIGLNINQTEFPPNISRPTSLKLETGKNLEINKVLKLFLKRFEHWIGILVKKDTKLIDNTYTKNMYLLGLYTNFMVNGQSITAAITGVDDYGRLCLKKNDNSDIKCEIKQVVFLP